MFKANQLPKATTGRSLGTFLTKEDVEALENPFDVERAVLKHVKLDDGREWDTFQYTISYHPNESLIVGEGQRGTFSLPVGAPESRTTRNRQHVLTLVRTFGGLSGVCLTSSEFEFELPDGTKETRTSYWLVDEDGDTILPEAS